MSYASLDDLTDAFGGRELIALTDRGEVATGAIDMSVINDALASADALIDGYVNRRYTLPMSPVPPLIPDLAVAIALYKLHRFGRPEEIKDDYKSALVSLRDIAEGKIKLPVEGKEPAQTNANSVQITDRERPLEASKMTGWI